MLKQKLLVTASAIALMATLTTAGVAQTPGGGAPGGAPEQQKMSPGAGDSSRGSGAEQRGTPKSDSRAQKDAESRPKASDRAEEKSAPKSRVQNEEGSSKSRAQNKDAGPKAAERDQEKASPKSAQQRDDGEKSRRARSADDKGETSRKKSDQVRAKDGDRDRVGEDTSKERNRDRAGRGDAKDSSKQSEAPSKDKSRAAGDNRRDDGRAEGPRKDRAEGQRTQGDRIQLTEEKRTTVRERMSKSARSNRVNNVNFDIRVGASVPRGTELHVLPANVVEIVPEYRDYRYVYVRDEIVIVDPDDYAVVAVIGGDSHARAGGSGHSTARVTLTADDRAFIREHIDFDTRVPHLGIGSFSVGMDLPDTVEMRPLPDVVVERLTDLRDHRYVVYEDDILIVAPDSRAVAFVVEGR